MLTFRLRQLLFSLARQRFPSIFIFHLFLISFLVAQEPGPAERFSDSLPPDLFEISTISMKPAEATVELLVKPNDEGDVILKLPSSVLSMKGQKLTSYDLLFPLGGVRAAQQFRCPIDVDNPLSLIIHAEVRSDTGEVLVQVTKVVDFVERESLAPDSENQRVPVVLESPDGKKRVEYMSRKEAVQKGLPVAKPKSQRKKEQPPAPENEDE